MAAFKKLIAFTIPVCFILGCSSQKSHSNTQHDESISVPKFIDGGKVMDSLKLVYKAKAIEYENWEEDDLRDSTLTVCIVDSPRPPSGNIAGTTTKLANIAREINRVIAEPKKYLSYYVIFVKTDTLHGLVTKSHSVGMEISKKQL